jgi:hypothetical protein
MWKFHNGHPVHDDDRRSFVAMSLFEELFASGAELCPENSSRKTYEL